MAEAIPRRQGAGHRRLDTAHAGVHVLSTLGGYARAHRALKRLGVPLAPFPAPSRPSVDRATEYPYDAQPERRPVAIPRRQQPRHADAAAAAARPEQTAEPYLDGAWWPRSTELPAELPALLTALSADLGPIALVGYHRDAWNAAPGHLDLAGHAVHLQGFASPDLPTVVVIADSGRRVTVQVVPPESDSATAAQAMMAATISMPSTTPMLESPKQKLPRRIRSTRSQRALPGYRATPAHSRPR